MEPLAEADKDAIAEEAMTDEVTKEVFTEQVDDTATAIKAVSESEAAADEPIVPVMDLKDKFCSNEIYFESKDTNLNKVRSSTQPSTSPIPPSRGLLNFDNYKLTYNDLPDSD